MRLLTSVNFRNLREIRRFLDVDVPVEKSVLTDSVLTGMFDTDL